MDVFFSEGMEFQKMIIKESKSIFQKQRYVLDKTPLFCKKCFLAFEYRSGHLGYHHFGQSVFFIFLKQGVKNLHSDFFVRCEVIGQNFSGAQSAWNMMVLVPPHLLACLSIYFYTVYICRDPNVSINNQVSTHHQVCVQHTLYSPVALLCVST